MPIIPCFDPTTGASGGPAGGGGTPVTPPAATTEAVAAGGSPSATTFGAFTDPGSVISSYQATLTSTVGTTALAGGSGLGPYTYSGFADGDSFVVELDAKDAGGNVVATAVHAVDIAAAAGGSTLSALAEFAGVNYDFLTTGGTSGTGGEGPHTVNGYTFTLSYNGTSGPDTLKFVSGVLTHVGNVSTKQAYLILDLGTDVSDIPYVLNLSTAGLGASAGQSFIYRIAEHGTPGAQDDTMGALFGWVAAGNLADDTAIMFREAASPTSYYTVQQVTGLTDITTTPTRTASHVMGGAILVSYDQGTAALPADGRVLANPLTQHVAIGNRVAVPQNRRYIHVFCLEDVQVRLDVLKLVIA
jgi:hypothetical protein